MIKNSLLERSYGYGHQTRAYIPVSKGQTLVASIITLLFGHFDAASKLGIE